MLLKDRVCVITGATRGIGLSIARLFCKEGGRVVVNGREAETCARVADAVGRAAGKAIGVAADVAVREQVESLFTEVCDTWGRVDVLVNNAGIHQVASMLELTEEQWNRTMQVNLNGVFYCVKSALPTMVEQGGGVILNMSSIAAKFGGKLPVHDYAASKAALIALTKSLAREFAGKNIRVNAICPGIIDTGLLSDEDVGKLRDMIPLGRLGKPEEIARAALYLVSDMSSYVTGEIHDVNGGMLMD